MTRVYLVRHAQAEGNLYRRAHGSYDSLVTPYGYAQIEALKKRFEKLHVDVVYSSPMFRARATAKAIYEPKHIPLYIMHELQEAKCGPWEDRTWGEIRYQDAEQLYNFNNDLAHWKLPGSETAKDIRDRMLAALGSIVRENPDRAVAVVTHGMSARILLGTLMGMSIDEISRDFPHGDNTAVSRIDFEDGKYHVDFVNDASHLSEEISTFAHQQWWKGREEMELRFVPFDLDSSVNAMVYQCCRMADWMERGSDPAKYHSDEVLREARMLQRNDPNAIIAAYHGEEFAGMLQVDTVSHCREDVGAVPMMYLLPAYTKSDADAQMIGEAVSRARRAGRKYLYFREANPLVQSMAERCGFRESRVPGWLNLCISY